MSQLSGVNTLLRARPERILEAARPFGRPEERQKWAFPTGQILYMTNLGTPLPAESDSPRPGENLD
jgi:hypothetical protein